MLQETLNFALEVATPAMKARNTKSVFETLSKSSRFLARLSSVVLDHKEG